MACQSFAFIYYKILAEVPHAVQNSRIHPGKRSDACKSKQTIAAGTNSFESKCATAIGGSKTICVWRKPQLCFQRNKNYCRLPRLALVSHNAGNLAAVCGQDNPQRSSRTRWQVQLPAGRAYITKTNILDPDTLRQMFH